MMQDELTFAEEFGLSWYCCGPTVYSHSHLGHGRCYVTFDAIRNTLENWFKVPTRYWMNITDIDDKIIAGAIQQRIDHRELSALWEADFLHKMDALNVRRPDKLLRVSQHIPEIIDYIQKIISNQYAYSEAGSVYFDLQKFQSDGHQYCRLLNSASQQASALEASNLQITEKRHQADFALWKSSKPGEPYWHSPWGKGRPGWHIECSAIIQTYLQENQKLDLHTGGSDLKFPHHSNEIAQGEAHDCSHNWVNFFLHVAPLTISGLKMSKSLKNFITLEEALSEASGEELRLLFLHHHYSKVMQYNPEGSVLEARAIWNSLISSVRQINKRISTSGYHKDLWDSRMQATAEHLQQVRLKIDSLLRNDFDFPAVIKELGILAKYVSEQAQGADTHPDELRQGRALIIAIADGVLGLKIWEKSQLPTLSASQSETLLQDFVGYREGVLQAVRNKDVTEVFRLSDTVRDQILPSYGVRIEDDKKTPDKKQTLVQPATEAAENKKLEADLQSTKRTSLFESPKYAKFKIGTIGSDGLPELDTAGKPFPPKVLERFKRDLQSHSGKS